MSKTTRTDIETLVAPAQYAYTDIWLREVLLQIICLRAELSGRNAAELAREVLPAARVPLTEQPHEHTLRDLIGARGR